MSVLVRNVIKLNIFAALKMMLFPMAIITLFWKDHIGLSLTQILILQVFFSAASVLMEYPSGYVSDRMGYKLSLVIACLFGIVGWSVYMVASSFFGVLCAELLLGVSYAFISGSDTALLFETLKAHDQQGLYSGCDGRMTSWAQIGEACGALLAGAMYASWPLLPFAVQIGVWVAALGLALSLHEPPAAHKKVITSHLTEALSICQQAFRHPDMRSAMLYGTVLGLASFYTVWLIQPYMQECAVPLAWFGPAWAGANLTVAVFSYFTHRIHRRLGLTAMSGLFWILIVSAYAGLGLTASVGSFLFYYLLTAMRGMQGPILRERLQLLSDRSNRASILSLHSLVFRLGFVLTGPLAGLPADHIGLQPTFLILAGLFALILPLLGREFLRHHRPIAENRRAA